MTTDVNTPIVDGIPDLDRTFGLVSGRLALVQAIARRLTTRRGELAWIGDDPDYGDDVRELLGEDVGTRAAFVLSQRIESQCLADERVLSARATTTITQGRAVATVQVADHDGVLRFTLAITDVSVEILKVF